jgi:hypothetical protein
VDTWQSIRWDRVVDGWLPGDRSQHSVEFSHLGDSRNRRVKTRQFNRRGCEIASSEIRRGRSQLSVDLSRLGGSQREGTRVRLANSRRCELREALTFKPSPRCMW